MQLSLDLSSAPADKPAAQTPPRVRLLSLQAREDRNFSVLKQDFKSTESGPHGRSGPLGLSGPSPAPEKTDGLAITPPSVIPDVEARQAALRRQIARLERGDPAKWGVIPFGDARVDAC